MLLAIFDYILSKLIFVYIKSTGKISLGKKVLFKRMPLIRIVKSGKIEIGDGTTINSLNRGYHINMFGKCKLYADKPNAEVIIGKNTRIHGTCVHAFNSIKIGNNCLIAANTHIIDGNGHHLSFDAPENRINTFDDGNPIVIEDNVWIAAGCYILGGTTIGNGSIITAGSVVKGVIPAKCIYGGNPAKLVKQY